MSDDRRFERDNGSSLIERAADVGGDSNFSLRVVFHINTWARQSYTTVLQRNKGACFLFLFLFSIFYFLFRFISFLLSFLFFAFPISHFPFSIFHFPFSIGHLSFVI